MSPDGGLRYVAASLQLQAFIASLRSSLGYSTVLPAAGQESDEDVTTQYRRVFLLPAIVLSLLYICSVLSVYLTLLSDPAWRSEPHRTRWKVLPTQPRAAGEVSGKRQGARGLGARLCQRGFPFPPTGVRDVPARSTPNGGTATIGDWRVCFVSMSITQA
jgi:hypothetical protein